MDVNNIIKILGINDKDILNIYMYGSRVYGCNLNGDYDLIIVVTGENYCHQINRENIDATIYSEDLFVEKIKEHEISILECLFLPEDKVLLKRKDYSFDLDLSVLRSSISRKASNSFVKCKKKLTVEKDYSPYIAKKSLFHSLRILIEGIQIAKYQKIIDYSQANYLWEEIVNNKVNDWSYYKEKYQPLYNKLNSEFRIYAPKNNID
jgi:predicted nucleotidyltransferase